MLHRTRGRLPGHQRRLGKRRPQVAPRPDAEILADAIKVVAPRAGEHKKRRELLMKCMEHLRAFRHNYDEMPSPAEFEKQLRERYERMKRVKADLVAPWTRQAPQDFIEMYDKQVRVAEDDWRSLAVPHGSQRPNIVAYSAVNNARILLKAFGYRVRGGRGQRLASLLYEFAAGEEPTRDLISKYMQMRGFGHPQGRLPRLLYPSK
jgi:hypothetical protein